MTNSEVYRHPQHYALGYRWNTEAECAFIESCVTRYGPAGARRLLDIGCGSGRHLVTLAQRGLQVHGIDVSPEMVAYVQEQIRTARLSATVAVGDLRRLALEGAYDAAFCFMDTFRFLLTNAEILAHLRAVAEHLTPGGLYLTDFWVPRRWEAIGSEVHQWEQAEGGRTVRVFYLQHPDSVDPVAQTFDDELVFEVKDGGEPQTIQGGRTRTRLILPQEFLALVEASGGFEPVGVFGEFALEKPLAPGSLSWRMISVLRRRTPAERTGDGQAQPAA